MLSTDNPVDIVPASGTTTPFYHEFLDERRRYIARIVMDYVIIFTISLVGVVTNALVIVVYAK